VTSVARRRLGAGAVAAHLRTPLYRNAYSLLAGSAATSVLGIAYWAVAARYAPPDQVGVGAALISLMILVSGVCQFGLQTVLHRFLPRAGRNATRLIVRSYATSAAASAVAAAGVAAVVGTWDSDISLVGDSPAWVLAFALMTACWSIFTLQDSVMTGLRQAHWVPIENTAFALAKIVLLIPLVAAAGAGGLFLSWTIPAAVALVPVTVLIFCRLLPRHLRAAAGSGSPLDRRLVVRAAWSNHLGTMFSVAFVTLLPIIVTTIVSAEENAYFYVAWSIALALQMVPVSMSISMLVEASVDEQRLAEHARRILWHSLRLLAPAVALVVAGAPLVLGVFGADYADQGSWALRLLALATMPALVVTVAINVARVRHDAMTVVGAQAAACLLGVGLGAALLPAAGITGAAFGLLAGQVLVALTVIPGLVRVLRPARAAG
jgi:O-antigen/teichoic acid export membrane protein